LWIALTMRSKGEMRVIQKSHRKYCGFVMRGLRPNKFLSSLTFQAEAVQKDKFD